MSDIENDSVMEVAHFIQPASKPESSQREIRQMTTELCDSILFELVRCNVTAFRRQSGELHTPTDEAHKV